MSRITTALSPAAPPPLPELQSRIGSWSRTAFGPTPPDLHANRLMKEAVDVADCAATGRVADMGRALAGVLVVALALADGEDIDLLAALVEEQAENEASHWVRTGWGHWRRAGDGGVDETPAALALADAVRDGHVAPRTASALLVAAGARFETAASWLTRRCGLDADAFQDPSPAPPFARPSLAGVAALVAWLEGAHPPSSVADLPCPGCAGKRVTVVSRPAPETDGFRCRTCGAQGDALWWLQSARGVDRDAALELWRGWVADGRPTHPADEAVARDLSSAD